MVEIDESGNIEIPFNSEGIYRAWKKGDGKVEVRTYKD